ncbi:MAG: S9 family peptidase, partial [Ferruginibacter sp.]
MFMILRMKIVLIACCFISSVSFAQKINWTDDGLAFTRIKDGNIVRVDPRNDGEAIIIRKDLLIPPGTTAALNPRSYEYSSDKTNVLAFTNTVKVWRYHTRGDYWIVNPSTNKLLQLGKNLPPQSLMFAKFSPDGKQVAYVSGHNIYSEDITTGIARKLTSDGSRKMINGTFDWVYEEEFGCRDGFRWSPDSKKIAFWQVNATKTRDYFMLNTTDSNYSKIVPVEYPKVGEPPSSVRIGVINLTGGQIRWMNIAGNPEQHYIPRMEWSNSGELIVQQLDRRQQESKLIYCNIADGSSYTFWAENDEAWVDLNTDDPKGWNWINKGQDFIWVSEKSGWRHIYKISRDGKTVTELTKGNYDIGSVKGIDEANNYIYFSASPNNPAQLYLYRVRINSTRQSEDAELLSGTSLKGTHTYQLSPNARLAKHTFSNYNTPPADEWITLPDNRILGNLKSITSKIKTDPSLNIEYMQLRTEDNILLDAWMNKPKNFDPKKKYPVVFYVYGEPAASTVDDEYGNHNNSLYDGDMSADGYIQVGIDNRGTPTLKGRAWRKSIYRKIGDINIRDMALGAKKL